MALSSDPAFDAAVHSSQLARLALLGSCWQRAVYTQTPELDRVRRNAGVLFALLILVCQRALAPFARLRQKHADNGAASAYDRSECSLS